MSQHQSRHIVFQRIARLMHVILGLRHCLLASEEAGVAQAAADRFVQDSKLNDKSQNLKAEQKGAFWQGVNTRSVFHLISIKHVLAVLQTNANLVNSAIQKWAQRDFEIVF